MAQERAVSISEAAHRFGVSDRTVRRMIGANKIRAFKISGQWRIRESEVERIMNEDQVSKDKPDQQD